MRDAVLLDEASLAPPLFAKLKRRVDAARRGESQQPVDVWVTRSNQTLLHQSVRASLAGRASYFDLNTLSVHELARADLFRIEDCLVRGGWPELYRDRALDPVRYLNDLLATFVERDIVLAAGIERREALALVLRLIAARVGQLVLRARRAAGDRSRAHEGRRGGRFSRARRKRARRRHRSQVVVR